MRSRTLFLCAFSLVVAACGDSTPTTTAPAPTTSSTTTTTTTSTTTTTAGPATDLKAYVAAVMATEDSADEVPIEDAEGACIADRTFDEFGAERFIEVGFDAESATTQPMSTFDDAWNDDEWETLVDSLFACADMKQKLTDSMTEAGLDDAAATCVGERYATGQLRAGMLDRDQGAAAEAALAELTTIVTECVAG